jgi:hypothetical protein
MVISDHGQWPWSLVELLSQLIVTVPCVSTRLTVEQRFWPKVDRREDDECWLWTAGKSQGYGTFSVNGVMRQAHTVAYELLVGPAPKDLVPDHLCRVTACVNPGHIEWVTQRENILRGVSLIARYARRTHCVVGRRDRAGDRRRALTEPRSRRTQRKEPAPGGWCGLFREARRYSMSGCAGRRPTSPPGCCPYTWARPRASLQ